MIELFFYIEPLSKKRPRFTRRGHTYTDPETRLYEDSIKAIAYTQMKNQNMLEGAISIWIVFIFEKPKSSKNRHMTVKPDNDNLQKGVLDALNGVCWKDDAQIVEIHSLKVYGEKHKIQLEAHKHEDAITPHFWTNHLSACRVTNPTTPAAG